jgi:hypothetical protein
VVTAPDADRPAHLSSFDRPLQIGWIDPGAAWCTVWIGEPHRADQWALLPFSHANESWIDLIEHQLGATEHLEAPLVVDVAPREVQEAIAALAVNYRTPEVRRAIRSGHNADVELPSGSGHVAGDKVVGFVSDLDTDMDVVEWSAVGIAEPPAREIESLDDNSHSLSFPRPPSLETPTAPATPSCSIPNRREVARPGGGMANPVQPISSNSPTRSPPTTPNAMKAALLSSVARNSGRSIEDTAQSGRRLPTAMTGTVSVAATHHLPATRQRPRRDRRSRNSGPPVDEPDEQEASDDRPDEHRHVGVTAELVSFRWRRANPMLTDHEQHADPGDRDRQREVAGDAVLLEYGSKTQGSPFHRDGSALRPHCATGVWWRRRGERPDLDAPLACCVGSPPIKSPWALALRTGAGRW